MGILSYLEEKRETQGLAQGGFKGTRKSGRRIYKTEKTVTDG